MNTGEIKTLIDLYMDNELEKSKESVLFSSMAADDEAREYFFNLNVIRNYVDNDTQPFPAVLEQKIFSSLKQKEKKDVFYYFRQRSFQYITAAAAVLLLALTMYLFTELRNYKYQITAITEQINLQNHTIDLILNNSLPPAEVRGRSINEVIVRANL